MADQSTRTLLLQGPHTNTHTASTNMSGGLPPPGVREETIQEVHTDSLHDQEEHTEITNGSATGTLSDRGVETAHKEQGVSCSLSSTSKPAVPPGLHSDMDRIGADGKAEGGAAEGADGGADGQRRGRVARALGSFWKEFAYLAHLGWPVVLTQCLHYTIGTVAIMFAGHRGKTELDVVALSTSVLSATAISVANGFSGYCDTIFAQVYGSDERKTLGTILQKCLLIITLGICPSLAAQINIYPLLLFMGHDHEVARLSEQYLMIHIPGSIAIFIYIVLSKYVQNQNREIPILVIALSANVLNAVLHAIFFIWLEAGVWCSALSQSLTCVSLMVLTIIYILVSGIYKETWQGWTTECFLTWGPYCKLGGFSLFQHCIEFWAFESGIILSGLLGMQMIAAQSIAYQYILILYTIAWGIGMTSGIRVGQHLGANNPTAARFSSRVTLTTAGLTGFVFFILVTSLRYQLPLIFTDDGEIIELVASILPIIAVAEIFDYLGASMNGILRGCGRQAIGTYITVPAFSFVLIVGLTLMLKTSLMIKGFWIAILCALASQSLIGTFFVLRLNWKNEAKKAQARVGGDMKEDALLKDAPESRELEIIVVPPSPDAKTETNPCLVQVKENTKLRTQNTKPSKLTTKIILLRVLAYGVSIGCLVISVIVRCVIDIPTETHSYANSTLPMWNVTTTVMDRLY